MAAKHKQIRPFRRTCIGTLLVWIIFFVFISATGTEDEDRHVGGTVRVRRQQVQGIDRVDDTETRDRMLNMLGAAPNEGQDVVLPAELVDHELDVENEAKAEILSSSDEDKRNAGLNREGPNGPDEIYEEKPVETVEQRIDELQESPEVKDEPPEEQRMDEVTGLNEVKVENLGLNEVKVENLGLNEVKVENPGLDEVKVESPNLGGVKIESPNLDGVKVEGLDEVKVGKRGLRTAPVNLRDFRMRTLTELERDPHCGVYNKSGTTQVKHRLETGGEKYNFAAASHGAKLVASNKEAKGSSNILNKDKEKYYRSPCSAEDKFVVIELSEETLVDTFVLANLEFYSSNLKEFELLGSLSYPTEEWISLGKFEAENARHAHSFQLQRPEWVRYLKLRMLSHYNSDFFCTLSMVEVYGIDAIECLMEEWFGKAKTSDGITGGDYSLSSTGLKSSNEAQVDLEGLSHSSRMGDSVLKVLMQKVKALELNQTLFEHYVDELISNYRGLFGDIDNDMVHVKETVQEISTSLASLAGVLFQMKDEKQADWNQLQAQLSKHVDVEAAHLESLRVQMRHMENRETVALTLAFALILVSCLSHILARCFKIDELSRLKSVFFWMSCLIAAVLSV